ncbi:hypothetical protein B0H16DRAFT_1422867 [Mycena metata]|uniref:Helicase C-terminal domain-containing protein n=1 Tax=Mycena metata TaxID=1033252 RepID=A0AAD7N458_9AGAR|nr:hypothetical protein B0H16DRAFT_1422867 [Mycena metata]
MVFVSQSPCDVPDAPRLFLLSTRSGGLDVNPTAADTVIFCDRDWVRERLICEIDAQAQDRAHCIGQTKPVLIFQLVSAHTIEEKIMQRATEKRKLEALVIAKGAFSPFPRPLSSPLTPLRRQIQDACLRRRQHATQAHDLDRDGCGPPAPRG